MGGHSSDSFPESMCLRVLGANGTPLGDTKRHLPKLWQRQGVHCAVLISAAGGLELLAPQDLDVGHLWISPKVLFDMAMRSACDRVAMKVLFWLEVTSPGRSPSLSRAIPRGIGSASTEPIPGCRRSPFWAVSFGSFLRGRSLAEAKERLRRYCLRRNRDLAVYQGVTCDAWLILGSTVSKPLSCGVS